MTNVWKSLELIVARGMLHTKQPPFIFRVKNSKADYLDHLRVEVWTWSSFGERGLTVVSDHLASEALRLYWLKLARQVEADREAFKMIFKRRPACEFEKEASR